MLRFLLWRMVALACALVGLALAARLLSGGLVQRLGSGARTGPSRRSPGGLGTWARRLAHALTALLPSWLGSLLLLGLAAGLLAALVVLALRTRARRRRTYTRLEVLPFRSDTADSRALARMFAALHAGLATHRGRRVIAGQSSVSVEVHRLSGGDETSPRLALAISFPAGQRAVIESALQVAYPNSRLGRDGPLLGAPPAVLRLRKHRFFIERTSTGSEERFERDPEPAMNRLMTMMGAVGGPAFVQLAMAPAPAWFEGLAKHLYRRHEAELSRRRREHLVRLDRSLVEEAELRGGLEIQHQPLFFVDIRVVADNRRDCERIASVLRLQRAENRFVERGTATRQGRMGLYAKRIRRGEANPLPDIGRGVLAAPELAELWQLPSIDYATVPFSRTALPLAPAPPEVYRPRRGPGTLRDSLGPVSIHVDLRRQNIAVPGGVDQGKSSYLVASVAEDLQRERCAVIVLDPKGDAAEAALSVVPPGRTCTLLDFAHPTCGFNPLAVGAPADVIADYVVAALKNLFTDGDIRASSDRYLRNAIIAVLAHDRRSSLWDAARLLSVGEEGYAYRLMVGAKVRALPELKEISQFFTAELTAQLADARSATTSKLDAPVNKLARLLNSASIKRVLLNDSLRVDFDRIITGAEVLIVKGALGAMGAGNTSVLMQLLVGMLDAALARQQDLVPAERRVAVALKVDEAPLVLNRGFAETMALKRSAGLETLACWQTDSQWVEREVRQQLDALFAHRVYFATASAEDARAGAALTMAEFSDSIRPETRHLSALGRPDVRLRLPRHHAIASWTTPTGRQAAFVAETIPMRVDPERLTQHVRAQHARGARHLADLRQPHWDPGAQQTAPPAGVPTDEPDVQAADCLAAPGEEQELPRPTTSGFAELADLDQALSARAAPRAPSRMELDLEPPDIEILILLGTFGYLLTSQIHRRINPSRAASTTQRRLKRLADAGLVDRFQFHRRDGGGVPMCCLLSSDGLRALEQQGGQCHWSGPVVPRLPHDGPQAENDLVRSRRMIRIAGWALAFSQLTGGELRGAEASAIAVPRSGLGARGSLSPSALRLPDGLVAHDFLRSNGGAERAEADHFDTVRPDAAAVFPARGPDRGLDLLIEFDGRPRSPAWVAKLERHEHFLTGWSANTGRYGKRGRAAAMTVFVCPDRTRARACAGRADALLCACLAYPGELPQNWDYTARRSIAFVAEREAYEGKLSGWGVPSLPPQVRVALADGDPSAGEATSVACNLPLGPDLDEAGSSDLRPE